MRGLFAQNGGVALLINCPRGEFHGVASSCSVPCSGLGVAVGHGSVLGHWDCFIPR